MKKLIIFFIIISVLLLPSLYGLGITPPTIRLEYEEGKIELLHFGIKNHRDIPINVKVEGVDGELTDYIQISYEEISIPAGGIANIPFKLYMNDSIQPGRVTSKISVLDTTKNGEGMFQVGVGVIGIITFFKPYPGIYPILSISAGNINEGEDLRFFVEISNKGLKKLSDTTLTTRLRSNDGTLIEKYNEQIQSIGGEESKKYSYIIPGKNLKSGAYTISVDYEYEDEIKKEIKGIQVGSYDILLEHYSKELYNSGITPVKMFVKSTWNEPLNDVYGTIKIKQKVYRSLPINLAPFGEGIMTVYVDYDNFQLGETYNANFTVHHEGNMFSSFGDLTVTEEDEDKEPVLETPTVTEEKEGFSLNITTLILIGAVVLLIVVNAFLLGQKSAHKEKNKKK
jgi:hypothetical protein